MSTINLQVERQEAKKIGEDNYEIQQELAVASARLISRFIENLLSRVKGLRDRNGPIKVSIKLGDSKEKKAALKTKSDPANLSEKDIDYLRMAMDTPASRDPHATLNRDISVSVNGREILRVKDGVVERNDFDILSKDAEAEVAPTSFRQGTQKTKSSSQEVSNNTPSGKAAVQADVQSAEIIDVAAHTVFEDVGETPEVSRVGVGETVPLEREMQQRRNIQESSPSKKTSPSPVIVILTREVQARVPNGKLKDNLIDALGAMGRAGRAFAQQIGSTFRNATAFVGAKFSQRENSLRDDLQNIAAVFTAHRLIEQHGQKIGDNKEVVEGFVYRFERSRDSLTVFAKDGRGTLLQERDGTISGNLTTDDAMRFRALHQHLAAQQSSNRTSARSQGEELQVG